MKKIVLMLVLGCMHINTVWGQVTIAPTSLFFDNKSRFETVVIMNSSDQAQEIKMNWQFGYPKTDASGNIVMVYDDSLTEAKYSAADWIHGFPKRFVLQAGSRQTIRVTVRAPRNLEPGTYWSRMVVESSPLSPPVGESTTDGVKAQINFSFRQITSVFFKNGDVHSGVDITNVSSEVEEGKLSVLADYTKKGNSPFLGTMRTKITDVLGEVVKDQFVYVSLYFDGKLKMDIDVQDLPMGSYDIEVNLIGQRADIPDSDTIPSDGAVAQGTFTKL